MLGQVTVQTVTGRREQQALQLEVVLKLREELGAGCVIQMFHLVECSWGLEK